MSSPRTFSAVIEEGDQGGAYVTIPFDVEQAYGKKRVKIKATFDGEPYRGSLVSMGAPSHFLLLRKDIRAKIGKGIGDTVEVTVEEDTEPRVVVVPEDLQQALRQHPDVEAFFAGLSFTHQREYVQWIEEAKRAPTRQRRIEQAIERMRQGQRGV